MPNQFSSTSKISTLTVTYKLQRWPSGQQMRGELARSTGKANRVWRVRFLSAKSWKMRGSRKRSRGKNGERFWRTRIWRTRVWRERENEREWRLRGQKGKNGMHRTLNWTAPRATDFGPRGKYRFTEVLRKAAERWQLDQSSSFPVMVFKRHCPCEVLERRLSETSRPRDHDTSIIAASI